MPNYHRFELSLAGRTLDEIAEHHALVLLDTSALRLDQMSNESRTILGGPAMRQEHTHQVIQTDYAIEFLRILQANPHITTIEEVVKEERKGLQRINGKYKARIGDRYRHAFERLNEHLDKNVLRLPADHENELDRIRSGVKKSFLDTQERFNQKVAEHHGVERFLGTNESLEGQHEPSYTAINLFSALLYSAKRQPAALVTENRMLLVYANDFFRKHDQEPNKSRDLSRAQIYTSFYNQYFYPAKCFNYRGYITWHLPGKDLESLPASFYETLSPRVKERLGILQTAVEQPRQEEQREEQK